MTNVDRYAPGAETLIEYKDLNACECDDFAWAEKLKRAYEEDFETLDKAFIAVFREWAAKHNL